VSKPPERTPYPTALPIRASTAAGLKNAVTYSLNVELRAMLTVSIIPLLASRLLIAIGVIIVETGLDSLNIRARRPIPGARMRWDRIAGFARGVTQEFPIYPPAQCRRVSRAISFQEFGIAAMLSNGYSNDSCIWIFLRGATRRDPAAGAGRNKLGVDVSGFPVWIYCKSLKSHKTGKVFGIMVRSPVPYRPFRSRNSSPSSRTTTLA
jgi:hypothetical protein